MAGEFPDAAADSDVLIPLNVDGQIVYLAVRRLADEGAGHSGESDISSRRPTLEQALDGLAGVARALGARLRQTEAQKVTVEFGCEFAVESGAFVAVIGKATAKSTFKVGLEWSRPTE